MSEETHASTKTILLLFWKALRRYRWLVALDFAFIIIAVASDSIAPWILKEIVDRLSTLPPGNEALRALIPLAAIASGLWALAWLGWRTSGFIATATQPKIMKYLSVSSFEYLIGHSYRFFSDSFSGALVRRVNRISIAFMRIIDECSYRFFPASIILIAALIALSFRSMLIAGVFGIWVIIFIVLNYIGARWKLVLDHQRAEMDSKVTGALSDAITNAVTIKTFARAGDEVSLFDAITDQWKALQIRAWRRGEIIHAVQGGLMVFLNATLLVIGIRLWAKGLLTVGDLVLIQTYLGLVFGKLWDIGRGFRNVYESLSDAREMVDILETPHEIRDRRKAKALTVKKGNIEFKEVTFAFQQTRIVLDNLSFSIAPREKIALVGPSGAGKSTVTKLLLRFFDVSGGRIEIDGQDIAKVTQDSLRKQIGLVPQDPILFHRTLRENIAYGRPDATEKEIMSASRKAHCHEFIADLPNGYDSYVGERGVKLSGGERQRIAIARAILKNAPILILDEATSSLDSESEQFIQEALRGLMKNKTVIVIAHRLSTVMQMDRIAVIEHGRVTDSGTHEELLNRMGTYKRLWEIQAGGFAEDDA